MSFPSLKDKQPPLLGWYPKFGEVFPEQLRVEGVQSWGRWRNHVCRGSGLPETTQCFQKYNSEICSTCCAWSWPGLSLRWRDIPRLLPHTAVSILFVNDGDVSILPVLWEGLMFPDVQATHEDVSFVFESLCRDFIGSNVFIVLQPCNGFMDIWVNCWGKIVLSGGGPWRAQTHQLIGPRPAPASWGHTMLIWHGKSLECCCCNRFWIAFCTHQVSSLVRRARWVAVLAVVKVVLRVGDPALSETRLAGVLPGGLKPVLLLEDSVGNDQLVLCTERSLSLLWFIFPSPCWPMTSLHTRCSVPTLALN